jgi:CheY-like chemotaxis protein
MKKILVVDDEKEIRDLIKERLTQNNYTVITASDGKEALEVAKANQPDLILLDIAMPEIDGYLTCEKLTKDAQTRKIPVLLLTGKDLESKSVIERCNEVGASDYVSKMSSLKELLDKVKEAIPE